MLVFRIWAMSVWSGKSICNIRTTTSERFFSEAYPCCWLSLLFLIFFTTSWKKILFIRMNFHSYFHEGICPLSPHISHYYLDLCFYFLWDSFVNILLFGYSNITFVHIASLRKHVLWFWILSDCFFRPWLFSKSIFQNTFFSFPSFLLHLKQRLLTRPKFCPCSKTK